MYIYIYVCVCVCVSLSIFPSLCVSLSLSFSLGFEPCSDDRPLIDLGSESHGFLADLQVKVRIVNLDLEKQKLSLTMQAEADFFALIMALLLWYEPVSENPIPRFEYG